MLAVLLLNRMNTKRRSNRQQIMSKTLKTEVKPKGKQTKSMNDYCRTCLATEDLMSIFYSKETEAKRTEDLRLVTGLVIKMNDGLSQKICTQCIDIMNTALQFRRRCRKAEKTLCSMANWATSKINKPVRKAKEKINHAEEHLNPDAEDYSISYDVYEDGFQNETYEFLEEARPKTKQKPSTVKKKRVVLPNTGQFKCNTCNKEFRMKATYKAHMRFHTNYRVCESCGKRCRNNNQLQEHKRARHGLGRIHKCAYCEYSSATKEALTIHERRHTGERPYICDHCGATFHRRSNLVQHIAIHLPEKNFQCDMCPKKLKSRKFLQIHKHNAHTGRRYAYLCPVCKHRFEKPNKVRAHARRVHGLTDDQLPPIARIQL